MSSFSRSKEDERQEIQQQIDDFLARGGRIERVVGSATQLWMKAGDKGVPVYDDGVDRRRFSFAKQRNLPTDEL